MIYTVFRLVFSSAIIVFGLIFLANGIGFAGSAEIISAKAEPRGSSRYDIVVEIRHNDEGWEHYADKWDVYSPKGDLLGTRKLLHPHQFEQPFIRALSGVVVPPQFKSIYIRAHDSVHGYNENLYEIILP